MFRAAAHAFLLFRSTCHAVKTWFELSRVSLYRNDLIESEGKQKLLRISGRVELSRARITESRIIVNVWRKSRGNRFWITSDQREVRVLGNRLYAWKSVLIRYVCVFVLIQFQERFQIDAFLTKNLSAWPHCIEMYAFWNENALVWGPARVNSDKRPDPKSSDSVKWNCDKRQPPSAKLRQWRRSQE